MARFDAATGKVVNSDAADQAISMVKFAEKMAAENEARLKALKAQQKLIKEPKPILNEKGYPTGEKTLAKGVVAGKPLMTDPKTGKIVTAPKGTVDPLAMPTYGKGGSGSKDNREVISPAEEYRRTMAEIAAQYDPLSSEAAAAKETAMQDVADAIKASGGDIAAGLKKFQASIGPSAAYQGVQLAAPALAGENPLMAALAGQGAGTGEVFQEQLQQNELANLQNKLAQEQVTAEAGWQQDLLNALRDYGTSASQYATDVTLPEKKTAGETKVTTDYQTEIDRLAKQRASEERAAQKKKAAAKVKVVVPKQKGK